MAAALDKSDVLAGDLGAGARAVAASGDISARSTADELVATADGLGGLDIVVNNAGITRDRMLFNMTDEGLRRGHRGPSARALPADPQCGDLLAGQGQGRRGRRAGHRARPAREHLVGGRSGRPAGTGPVRCAKAGITALTGVGRPRAGPVTACAPT